MRHGKIRYLVLMGNAESPERDTQVCIPKALPTYPAKYFFNNNSNDHMRQLWESVKGKKGSKRSLNAKLDSIERTAKDVLEEEFGLVGGKKGNRTEPNQRIIPGGAYGNFRLLRYRVLPPSPNRTNKCDI